MLSHEHQLQVECVKWFRIQYPKLAGLLFAIPNGGLRDIRVATRLKAEGVLPGVPDLFFAYPAAGWNGFFIEMKYGKNTVTDAQKEMINQLSEAGYWCAIVYSFDQFRREIENYLQYD